MATILERLINEIQYSVGIDPTDFGYVIGPKGFFCQEYSEDGKEILGTYKINISIEKVENAISE